MPLACGEAGHPMGVLGGDPGQYCRVVRFGHPLDGRACEELNMFCFATLCHLLRGECSVLFALTASLAACSLQEKT